VRSATEMDKYNTIYKNSQFNKERRNRMKTTTVYNGSTNKKKLRSKK